MKRKIIHNDAVVTAFVAKLALLEDGAVTDTTIVQATNEEFFKNINVGLQALTMNRQVAPLTPSMIARVSGVCWYSLIYRGVNFELARGNGAMTYPLVSALETYLEENPDQRSLFQDQQIKSTELADVIFSSEYDNTIALIAIEGIMAEIQEQNEAKAAQDAPASKE